MVTTPENVDNSRKLTCISFLLFSSVEMAALPPSGTWSNLSEWLMYCLCNVRGSVICLTNTNFGRRDVFVRIIADTLAAYRRRYLGTALGIKAMGVQSSLRNELVRVNMFDVPSDVGLIRISTVKAKEMVLSANKATTLGIAVSFKMRPPWATLYFDFDFYNGHKCVIPIAAKPPINIIEDDAAVELDDAMEIDEIIPDALDIDVIPPLIHPIQRIDESLVVVPKKHFVRPFRPIPLAKKTLAPDSWLSDCFFCHEVPFPPWTTMTCGHLICKPCFEQLGKMTNCPVCDKKIGEELVPGFILEGIAKASGLTIPCRFDECDKNIAWDLARAHYETCPHRDLTCPLDTMCEWTGSFAEVADHVIAEHDAIMVDDPTKLDIDVDITQRTKLVWSIPMLYINIIPMVDNTRGIMDKVDITCASLRPDPVRIRVEVRNTDLDFAGLWYCTAKPIEDLDNLAGVIVPAYTTFKISIIRVDKDTNMPQRVPKRDREEDDEIVQPDTKKARSENDDQTKNLRLESEGEETVDKIDEDPLPVVNPMRKVEYSSNDEEEEEEEEDEDDDYSSDDEKGVKKNNS